MWQLFACLHVHVCSHVGVYVSLRGAPRWACVCENKQRAQWWSRAAPFNGTNVWPPTVNNNTRVNSNKLTGPLNKMSLWQTRLVAFGLSSCNVAPKRSRRETHKDIFGGRVFCYHARWILQFPALLCFLPSLFRLFILPRSIYHSFFRRLFPRHTRRRFPPLFYFRHAGWASLDKNRKVRLINIWRCTFL